MSGFYGVCSIQVEKIPARAYQIALEQGSSPNAAHKGDLKVSFLFASGSSTHTVLLLRPSKQCLGMDMELGIH